MGVMLDTRVVIAAERRRFDMPAFLASRGEESVAMAAITASELLFGVERASDPAQRAKRGAFVEGALATLPIMPFALLEARRHAQLWAELVRAGTPIGAHDLQIAATALASDFAVATLNRTEFARVPGLALVETEAFALGG